LVERGDIAQSQRVGVRST